MLIVSQEYNLLTEIKLSRSEILIALNMWAVTWQKQQSECASSKDPDQP